MTDEFSGNPVAEDDATPGEAAAPDYRIGMLGTLVAFAIRRMHQYLRIGLRPIVEAAGLKSHQFTALSLIVDNPGISQREVAQALGIKPSNMVPLVDELELRGLVKRNPAATNRRSYALVADREGRQLRDRVIAEIAAHEAKLLSFLSPDEHAVLTSLPHRLDALARD